MTQPRLRGGSKNGSFATATELFDRRLDFLNLCPASDLPGDVRPLIARYGATCQPGTLVNWLNTQIRSCEIRTWDDSDDCRPTGNEWRMCAPFFDHGYTTYEAPTLPRTVSRGARR